MVGCKVGRDNTHGNGRGWGSMQRTVRERVADGDKDILCGAVLGSITCPHVILYFSHILHMFSSKL